jgi:hypothetical protein
MVIDIMEKGEIYMRKNVSLVLRLFVLSILLITLAACSDITAPTISKNGELTYTMGDEAIDFDDFFTALDDSVGDVSAFIEVDDSAVDYTTAGTYQIIVSVEDSAGNKAEETFDLVVIFVDLEVPEITGMVDVSLEQGTTSYDYLNGVTASDNLDGDLTEDITVDDSAVDYLTVGTYEVVYSVSDAAGNEATEEITVTITTETVAPTLDGITDLSVGLNGTEPSLVDGVTATDNIVGDLTASIVVSHDTIDTSMLGSYTITYTVTDAAGNTTTETATLSVVDDVPPVIAGHRDLTFNVFSNPTFLWKTVSAIDNIDGDILGSIVVDSSDVDMNVVGSYDLTYTVSDSAGNTTSVTVTVTVKDYIAPDYVENAIIYYLDGDDAPVYSDYISVIDNYDGDVTANVVFDDSSVDLNTVGVYSISMTVDDSSGNTSTATLTLVVPSATAVDNVNNDITDVVLPTTPIDANLVLPSVGLNGSTITWDSLNDSRMTDAGKILPPGIGEENATVTLVGTYSFDTYVKVVEYELTVAPKPESTINSKQTYDFFALGEEYVVNTDGTIDAYFELNGNVPYVDIEDLLAVSDGAVEFELLNFSYTAPILTVTYDIEYEDDDGVMQIETLSATFDFDENTVTSASMDFFGYYLATSSSDFGEGLIYIGSEGLDPHEITFDLGYYGFDMVVYDDNGEDKFLVPFNILELLLFGDTYYDVYYNGDAFYGTEHWQMSSSSNPNAITARTSSFNNVTASRDVKMAAYNYIAFAMDHFYGIKHVTDIDTYYTELEPYIDDMIFSNDIDFYRSLYEFIYSLDDLHSSHTSPGYYEPSTYNYQLTLGDLGDRSAGYYQTYWSAQDLYENKYEINLETQNVPSPYVIPESNTAIIHIEGFAITTPDEFKAALDSLDPSIENVVIDIALNGGGNIGAAWRIFGYLTEEAYGASYQNPLDGSAATYFYESEYDAYDYNFFVLTSGVSFSAANSFAAMAQYVGIPVIGRDTSGGASSIQIIQPFGGSILIISSNSVSSTRVMNEETGEYEYISIEYGVEVDYELTDFLSDEEILEAINDLLNQESETTE